MNQYTYHTTVLNADGDFRPDDQAQRPVRYVGRLQADRVACARHGRCFQSAPYGVSGVGKQAAQTAPDAPACRANFLKCLPTPVSRARKVR